MPLGGVLSPIVFVIYTSELANKISKLDIACSMYADDIKVYKVIKETSNIEILQAAIDYAKSWPNRWGYPPKELSCFGLEILG